MRHASLSPLNRLLIALCHRDAESRTADRELDLVSETAQWDALLATAYAHRVHGVVLTSLERMARRPSLAHGVLAKERFEPLRLLRRQGVGWDLEQRRVLAWLEKHGASPVVLKGGALRHSAYRESVERPVSDLDLLFHRDAIAGARRILEGLGYRDPNSAVANALYVEHHFHTQMEHAGGFKLELHWGLTPPGPHSQIDPESVIREARPVMHAGCAFLAPCPEHMVLHLTSQSTEDSLSRLGRIVDVDRAIARAGGSFDWERLRVAAAVGWLQNVLGMTLRLAVLFFDTPVPSGFVASLRIPRFTRVNLAALRPVEWITGQRALKHGAVRTLMKAWLETAPGARADIAMKVFRLRTDPLKLLHDAVEPDPHMQRSRLRNWIPGFLKVAGYQLFVWSRAITNHFLAPAREEADFWESSGEADGPR